MRARRREVAAPAAASAAIFDRIVAMPEVAAARTVAAFTSIPGEPDTGPLIEWCRRSGRTVVLPEDEPAPDPGTVDVVVVPGVAFTADGRRLGQGGGWYDRFLARLRAEAVTIGVAFEVQIVESLPTEPHDVAVDCVVTEAAARWSS